MKLVAVIVIVLATLAATLPPREGARLLINERRVNHGCLTLRETGPRLLRSAQQHSQKMADAGRIFHSVLKIDGWSKVGEVVGVAGQWEIIIDLLFESIEHRRILLDCHYDKIALGFVFQDGQAWLTGRLYAQ